MKQASKLNRGKIFLLSISLKFDLHHFILFPSHHRRSISICFFPSFCMNVIYSNQISYVYCVKWTVQKIDIWTVPIATGMDGDSSFFRAPFAIFVRFGFFFPFFSYTSTINCEAEANLSYKWNVKYYVYGKIYNTLCEIYTIMKIIRWHFLAFVAVTVTAIICDSCHGNYLPRVVWHKLLV